MKTDESKHYEEKFSEGYSERCTEIKEAILIVVEDSLYQLTQRQLNKFKSIRLHSSSLDRKHRSLDYVRKYGILINDDVKVYNY